MGREFTLSTRNVAMQGPELATKFTRKEIELLEAGKVPQTLTWHHNQQPGKMQIVDYFEHQSASHTGGRAIWGWW